MLKYGVAAVRVIGARLFASLSCGDAGLETTIIACLTRVLYETVLRSEPARFAHARAVTLQRAAVAALPDIAEARSTRGAAIGASIAR